MRKHVLLEVWCSRQRGRQSSPVHLFGIRNVKSFPPYTRCSRQQHRHHCLFLTRPYQARTITIVHLSQPAMMAGITVFTAWLAFAALFIIRVRAGWDMLSPNYANQQGVARPAEQSTENRNRRWTWHILDPGQSVEDQTEMLIRLLSRGSLGLTATERPARELSQMLCTQAARATSQMSCAQTLVHLG
jgi:hypothetical protein